MRSRMSTITGDGYSLTTTGRRPSRTGAKSTGSRAVPSTSAQGPNVGARSSTRYDRG